MATAPGRVTVVSRLRAPEAPESLTDDDSGARLLSRADNCGLAAEVRRAQAEGPGDCHALVREGNGQGRQDVAAWLHARVYEHDHFAGGLAKADVEGRRPAEPRARPDDLDGGGIVGLAGLREP